MGREVPLMCPSRKYGIAVNSSGILRVRCTGKFCKGPVGTVTFHMFDLATGELVRTELPKYRNPRELLGAGR